MLTSACSDADLSAFFTRDEVSSNMSIMSSFSARSI